MVDAALLWGEDLASSPVGDIAVILGSSAGRQRLLRRLLTNPGDYLWHPDYGAGLAEFVGNPCDAQKIRAKIRGQIFAEDAVAQSPEPVIDVQATPDGSVYVSIRYVDAPSGSSQVLSFSLGQ